MWSSGMSRVNFPNCLRTLKHFSSSPSSVGSDAICVNKVGEVSTIGINRPSQRNCLDEKTACLLRDAFRTFEEDDSVKVAVLHGVGGNFCSGFDLKELSSKNTSAFNTLSEGPMGPTRMFIKKPVIAAVSGYAVGGGFELALLCDLRVVEETAVMGVYNRRFGVPLIDGGTVRLPALIGLSRALDLILTGRSIKASEALEWGLANRMVACGTALGQAITLASSLIKFPQHCLLADRQSCYYSVFSASSLEDALKHEAANISDSVLYEAVKGAKKFTEGIGKHGKFHSLNDDFDKHKLA